ncbi:heavy-metal-associated domain-containing protein [Patescibacteria group bacterium]|nr:heavy-metal-associated domain-containing protein [Patescibacteria group bacterium]MCH8889211.1 heavy-metal-associated domain-containing protein [Patescibacteria group bacterium]
MATKKVTFNIEGMHCGACATGIQMISEGMDGVVKAFVDYDKKSGEIEFDPEKLKIETLFAEIKKLGYTATEASS